MATFGCDNLTNSAGTGAVNFPYGMTTPSAPALIKDINNANYVMLTTDGYNYLTSFETLTASRTITLPAAASSVGRSIRISRVDSSGFVINIATGNSGADTINGSSGSTANVLTAQYSFVDLFCNSTTSWTVVAVSDSIIVTLNSGSPVSLSTNVIADVISGGISIPPGSWDLSGVVAFGPQTNTSVTQLVGFIGTTTGNSNNGQNSATNTAYFEIAANVLGGFTTTLPLPQWRQALTSATSYYLKAQGVFTVNTLVAYGTFKADRKI